MMRLALNVLALSVLAVAGLAACSANFKPNTVTFAHGQSATANMSADNVSAAPVPASAATPAATSATPVASATPQSAAPAAASTGPAAGVTTTTAPAAPINMPTRGMSMSQVEHQFGAPAEKLPAVPDPGTKLHPPITRWVYPEYVVYFEYNYVVHSVLKAHPFSNPDAGSR